MYPSGLSLSGELPERLIVAERATNLDTPFIEIFVFGDHYLSQSIHDCIAIISWDQKERERGDALSKALPKRCEMALTRNWSAGFHFDLTMSTESENRKGTYLNSSNTRTGLFQLLPRRRRLLFQLCNLIPSLVPFHRDSNAMTHL